MKAPEVDFSILAQPSEVHVLFARELDSRLHVHFSYLKIEVNISKVNSRA